MCTYSPLSVKIFPKIYESLSLSCNSVDARKSLYLDLYQWNVEKKSFHLRTDRQQQIWRITRDTCSTQMYLKYTKCNYDIFFLFRRILQSILIEIYKWIKLWYLASEISTCASFSFLPFSSVFVNIWISINVHDPLIIHANETERFVDFNASVILDKWPFGRIQCKWRRRVCQSAKKVLTLSFVLFSRVKTRIWRAVEHRLRNYRLTPGQVDA